MICVYQCVFVCFGVKFISVLDFDSEVKGRARGKMGIVVIEPSKSTAAGAFVSTGLSHGGVQVMCAPGVCVLKFAIERRAMDEDLDRLSGGRGGDLAPSPKRTDT